MGGLKHRTNLGNIKASGGKFYGKTRHEGKFYVVGSMTAQGFHYSPCIVSINTDGSPDTSFSVGSGFNASLVTMALQSDGKVLVAGNFTSYNGTTTNRIARLNTDGSLDTSFSTGSGLDYSPYRVTVQSDGKVLAVGWFSSYNGTSTNCIARLNTDGSLDTSFSIGSGFNSLVYKAFQSDGKILVAGGFTSYNGNSTYNIAKLNIDGSFVTDSPEQFPYDTINSSCAGILLE